MPKLDSLYELIWPLTSVVFLIIYIAGLILVLNWPNVKIKAFFVLFFLLESLLSCCSLLLWHVIPKLTGSYTFASSQVFPVLMRGAGVLALVFLIIGIAQMPNCFATAKKQEDMGDELIEITD